MKVLSLGLSPPRYLGLHVGVVVILQQQRRRFGVVLPGGDVQRWQPHLALGVILQQDGHRLVVSMLQCHSQRGETVLGAGNKGCSAQPDSLGELHCALRAHQLGKNIPSCFPPLHSISRDMRMEAQHFNSFKHLQKASKHLKCFERSFTLQSGLF